MSALTISSRHDTSELMKKQGAEGRRRTTSENFDKIRESTSRAESPVLGLSNKRKYITIALKSTQHLRMPLGDLGLLGRR